MKNLFDRIWDWMKNTAWFQVVLLVGVVVAVVLSISPITNAISDAVANAEREKYYEYNRINYDTLLDNINKLDSGEQDGFAVIFVNPSDADYSEVQEGIDTYEQTDNAVKIYQFNVTINDDNASSNQYNDDANWYAYYETNIDEMTNIRNASIDVYEEWQEASKSNLNEVEQTSEYADPSSTDSCLSTPTLIWFESNDNIDPAVREMSKVASASTDEVFDFHIAKVYLDLQDSVSGTSEVSIATLSGLNKFFGTTVLDN